MKEPYKSWAMMTGYDWATERVFQKKKREITVRLSPQIYQERGGLPREKRTVV